MDRQESTGRLGRRACRARTGSSRVRAGAKAQLALLAVLAGAAILSAAPATGYAEGGGAAAVSWGFNYNTQLGAGYKDIHEESPVAVVGLSSITEVSAGVGHSLALLANGTVRAWGYNHAGQLGDGTQLGTWEKEASHVTVTELTESGGVRELTGVKAVSAGDSHSLALLGNGRVEAWGGNLEGELGDGRGGFERNNPTEREPYGLRAKAVKGLAGVVAIAAGGGSDYALMNDHTMMAWGDNGEGQLGIGEIAPPECLETEAGEQPCSKVPRPVVIPVVNAGGERELRPLKHVVAIGAGRESAYALLSNHHVMAWGVNRLGQLGTGIGAGTGGPAVRNVVPEEVRSAITGKPLGGVVAIAAGESHVLALLENGEVVGWGASEQGELGPASGEECRRLACDEEARPIKGLEKVTAISAGREYSLALVGGRVYSFGKNENGELGDGTTSPSSVPTAIPGLERVSAISAGGNHALALLQGGVEQPPPLVTLVPGVESLKPDWNVANAEKVRARPSGSESDEWIESHDLSRGMRSFAFTGLKPQSYEIALNAGGKKLVMIGTPRCRCRK